MFQGSRHRYSMNEAWGGEGKEHKLILPILQVKVVSIDNIDIIIIVMH